MAQWYYLSGGRTAGPVDDHQLRRWASDGALAPETLVLRAGTEHWVEVRTVAWELGLPAQWVPPPAQPAPVAAWSAGAGAARGPGGVPLAAWWRRILAYLLDGFVLGIPLSLLTGLFLPATTVEWVDGVPVVSNTGSLAVQVVLVMVAGFFYWGLLDGRRQTVGKLVLRIRVLDADTGRAVGLWRAGLRYVLIQLFFLACIVPGVLDVLWPLWDARRQSLHDKVASTVVVDVT